MKTIEDTIKHSESLKQEFLNLTDNQSIANVFNISLESLIFNIYRIPESQKYIEFKVSKKAGGERIISSPCLNLKKIQKKLSYILQLFYDPPIAVQGFTKNRNIIGNARMHQKKRYVLNVDLEDFFTTIHFGRIRGLFMSSPFNFNSKVATTLANLCCFKGVLPQGAPTSPILSNMICKKLDRELLKYARENRSRYTRYADDITISTDLNTPPVWLGEVTAQAFRLNQELEQIIIANSFKVNLKKVRLLNYNQRQMVTGLVVNQEVNVLRKYYRQIRTMLYLWDTLGFKNAERIYNETWQKKHKPEFKKTPSLEWVVQGKINFLKDVKGKDSVLFKKLENKFSLLKIKDLYEMARLTSARQDAGYSLQDILQELFRINNIECHKSFTRRGGADQIDGGFKLRGTFLVECKWKEKVVKEDLGGLLMKLSVSNSHVRGLFLSVNGWAKNSVKDLKESSSKRIILMNGEDIQFVLDGKITLRALLERKIDEFEYRSEPFLPAKDCIS